MSGCFSSRSTISFFITVVEFTEIFSQVQSCSLFGKISPKFLRTWRIKSSQCYAKGVSTADIEEHIRNI